MTTSAPSTPLTPTLRRVAQYLADGLDAHNIAAQTGLSAATVRQYIRDIRVRLNCPPRCKLPMIVHRLFTTQQVAPPRADRATPHLGADQRRLLRAVAEHDAPRDIALAATLAPADLRAALDQLLADTHARDTTHLVILAYGWNLLAAEPARETRNGASQ
ncbi:LuxR C-terminal-related transcriptional regulator [Streptomyces montanisoli]|uniref:DNA-binding protein n=1 Tax=Streptomyces montanisoli TaxID=2798581 RepID=A0A940RVJ2_9ACTN|nr:LuxR C-terminal-related transcriptional regulator [Streptomyces montanisoli]MBP0456143.1 DNA-binding protein [Streptomyces montanisoli]